MLVLPLLTAVPAALLQPMIQAGTPVRAVMAAQAEVTGTFLQVVEQAEVTVTPSQTVATQEAPAQEATVQLDPVAARRFWWQWRKWFHYE